MWLKPQNEYRWIAFIKKSSVILNNLTSLFSINFIFKFSNKYEMYKYKQILPLTLSKTRKTVFQGTWETGREKQNYKHSDSVSVTHWYCSLYMD